MITKVSKTTFRNTFKENLSFFMRGLFKPVIRNIIYEIYRFKYFNFLEFSVVETFNLRNSLKNVISHEILKYVAPQERNDNDLNPLSVATEDLGAEPDEVFGNLPLSEIDATDFVKLNYAEYKAYLARFVSLMRAASWEDHQFADVKEIEKMISFSLEVQAPHAAELRTYYLLDMDCIPNYRKSFLGVYSYHITVISTLKYDRRIIVMTYGND